ncbi:hypothetical protein EGW08_005625, partial [Elysia chlorotica]
GFWSQDGCRVVRTNRSHTKCECDHLTNFAVLMDVHGVEVSRLTCSIPRSLQGERNTIHKNLSLCLLLAELLFVCGIDQAHHKVSCAVIAGFLHFLFLCAFTWMLLEGIHIIFMLVQVFEAATSRLPYYYITGYGVPTVVVGMSLIFYHEGYGTEKFCWLTTEHYFIWAFAGPVGLILLVSDSTERNIALSLVSFKRYSSTFNWLSVTRIIEPYCSNSSWVQGAVALEVLLGLTWLFGYFLISESTTPVAYIFTVLNSLQGLFIFVFHCLLSKKAQKEYSQVLRGLKVKRTTSLRGVASTTRRTSNSNATNGTNSTNMHNHHHHHHHHHHQQQQQHTVSSSNNTSNSEKIELNGNTEYHQRLHTGSAGPDSSGEVMTLPV